MNNMKGKDIMKKVSLIIIKEVVKNQEDAIFFVFPPHGFDGEIHLPTRHGIILGPPSTARTPLL